MIWGFARWVTNRFCPKSMLQGHKKLEGKQGTCFFSVLFPVSINITLIIVLHSISSDWLPVGSSDPAIPVAASLFPLRNSSTSCLGFSPLRSESSSMDLLNYFFRWILFWIPEVTAPVRLCPLLRGLPVVASFLQTSHPSGLTPQMSGSKLSLKLLNPINPKSSLGLHIPEGGNYFLQLLPWWYFPLEFNSIKTYL